jgi:hypothetical protein
MFRAFYPMQNGEICPQKLTLIPYYKQKFATNWTCVVFQDLGDLRISHQPLLFSWKMCLIKTYYHGPNACVVLFKVKSFIGLNH